MFQTNFEDLNKSNNLLNALFELTNEIKQFDKAITKDNLQTKFLNFSNNWNTLKKSIPESYEVVNCDEIR